MSISTNDMYRYKTMVTNAFDLDNANDNSTIFVTIENKWHINNTSQIESNIANFISKNGEQNRNPKILVSSLITILANDLFEVYIVNDPKYTDQLQGQKGLRLKESAPTLPAFTVLTEYFGVTHSLAEFKRWFPEDNEISEYHQQMAYSIPLPHYPLCEHFIANQTFANKWEKQENQLFGDNSNDNEICISTTLLGGADTPMFAKINDGRDRTEMQEKTSSKNDNVMFIDATYRYWPHAFFVTKTVIKPGDPLLVFYGPDYFV